MFKGSLGKTMAALVVVAALHLPLGLSQADAAMTAQGIGSIPYETSLFSSTPEARDRQKAIELAKQNALERHTSKFSAAKYQLYQSVEKEVLRKLDQYVIDATVVDEGYNKDSRTYSVTVRATINDARLDALLNASSAAAGSLLSSDKKVAISYLFVARRVDSVRQFDARKTVVEHRQSGKSVKEESRLRKGGAEFSDSTEETSSSTTGGSVLRKADKVRYVVSSPQDINSAMLDVFSTNGFTVYDYRDVVGECGGAAPEKAYAEFAEGDRLSRRTRSVAFAAARSCDVNTFALGTLDVGLQEVDPVTGNKRVFVSVRSQVMNIAGRLPRVIASVGPLQYSGLGPSQDVAIRAALRIAATEVAKTISDQLKSKGFN